MDVQVLKQAAKARCPDLLRGYEDFLKGGCVANRFTINAERPISRRVAKG